PAAEILSCPVSRCVTFPSRPWPFRGFSFSSRGRHTRFSRDWSSDVCSSDLPRARFDTPVYPRRECIRAGPGGDILLDNRPETTPIGRASCREGAEVSLVAGRGKRRTKALNAEERSAEKHRVGRAERADSTQT